MSLEIKFSIDEILKESLKGTGTKKANPYKYVYDEINEVTSKAIIAGDDNILINKKVNQVFAKHKDEIKQGLKDDIVNKSGYDWDEIRSQDSFGITRAQRVESSFVNVKRNVMQSTVKNKRRYNDMIKHLEKGNTGILSRMGANGANQEEILRDIARQLTDSITTGNSLTLNNSHRRLVNTESHAIVQNARLKDLKGKPVIWRGSDDACEICQPYLNKKFKDAVLAPAIPVHPNCRCYLQEDK